MQVEQAQPGEGTGIGRLVEFGVDVPWKAVLLLPVSYEDFTAWQDTASGFAEGMAVVLRGRVHTSMQTTFPGSGPPRGAVRIELEDGTVVSATWFGDTRDLAKQMPVGATVVLAGTLKVFSGAWSLTSPKLVAEAWLGRCRPVYPSLGKRMGQDTLRERVMAMARGHLDAAAAGLAKSLPGDLDEHTVLGHIAAPPEIESLSRLLVRAHFPKSVATGEAALAALDRLAAWAALEGLMAERGRTAKRKALVLDTARASQVIPVELTQDQWAAIEHAKEVLGGDEPRSMLLSGDVGSGKTYVYLVIAAAMVAAGGRVAILLPNSAVAGQIHEQVVKLYPGIRSALIEGGSRADVLAAQVLVGTTALLHRKLGVLDLVVCDEQQKLGAGQRRALLGQGTHMLEVSATAIPRTLALARYGMIETHHLASGHALKDIRTRRWSMHDAGKLMAELRHDIQGGDRVLIVYPVINETSGKQAMRSIEAAIGKWEKTFPGKVRTLMGTMSAEEKKVALDALVEGSAQVGICTSLVEVGINVPRMRRVVVVNPERFGLTTLHQMRGRLAREGGHGCFDLLLASSISDNADERLRVLEKTSDGMEIAEADLKLRGAGEITESGERQSGSTLSILPARELKVELLEMMWPVAERHHQTEAEK